MIVSYSHSNPCSFQSHCRSAYLLQHDSCSWLWMGIVVLTCWTWTYPPAWQFNTNLPRFVRHEGGISRLFPFRKPLSWAAIIFAPLTLVSPYLVIKLQLTGIFCFPSAVFKGIPAILVVVVNKLLFIAWIDFSFICGYPIYDLCGPLPG